MITSCWSVIRVDSALQTSSWSVSGLSVTPAMLVCSRQSVIACNAGLYCRQSVINLQCWSVAGNCQPCNTDQLQVCHCNPAVTDQLLVCHCRVAVTDQLLVCIAVLTVHYRPAAGLSLQGCSDRPAAGQSLLTVQYRPAAGNIATLQYRPAAGQSLPALQYRPAAGQSLPTLHYRPQQAITANPAILPAAGLYCRVDSDYPLLVCIAGLAVIACCWSVLQGWQ